MFHHIIKSELIFIRIANTDGGGFLPYLQRKELALPHHGSKSMARKDLLISIVSMIIMIIGYQNVYKIPVEYRFLLKFIVYGSCYAMLLSWLRLRQRAKGVDPEGREGYRELFKFSVWYVSILMIIEIPGILVDLASVEI